MQHHPLGVVLWYRKLEFVEVNARPEQHCHSEPVRTLVWQSPGFWIFFELFVEGNCGYRIATFFVMGLTSACNKKTQHTEMLCFLLRSIGRQPSSAWTQVRKTLGDRRRYIDWLPGFSLVRPQGKLSQEHSARPDGRSAFHGISERPASQGSRFVKPFQNFPKLPGKPGPALVFQFLRNTVKALRNGTGDCR